jgi:GH24 family phage-related lysozyme (muramidase)
MATIPQQAIDLIKQFEGFATAAYPDPLSGAEPYTIGYGSTVKANGRRVQLGDTITEAEATQLLLLKLENQFLPPQTRIPNWNNLGDGQRSAILSFAYNLGAAFYGSSDFPTLTRVLRDGLWDDIERAFSLYRNPGTNVELGLLRRRLTEAQLFLSEVPGVAFSFAGQQFLDGRISLQTYLDSRTGGTVNPAPEPEIDYAPGDRTLFLNDPFLQGKDVQALQTALTKQGITVGTDGVFGPGTEAAVKTFQSAKRLTDDGVVGPTTWGQVLRLTDSVTPPPVPTPAKVYEPGDRTLALADPRLQGEDVKAAQSALSQQGVTVGTDGVFGPGTEAAVKSFQAAKNLTDDGVIGPATWAQLLKSVFLLRVNKSTVLKLRPEDQGQLAEGEKQAIAAGSTYLLSSYAYANPTQGDFSGHIKCAFQGARFKGFNTWFIYGGHAQVEFEGEVVYPREEQQATFTLTVTRNTIFKQSPIASSLLPSSQKHNVPQGTQFELNSYAFQDAGGSFSSHIKISLKHETDYLQGLSQWFVYDQHGYVEYDGKIVYPQSPMLRVTQNTVLKRRPVSSSQLGNNEKFSSRVGAQIPLHSWAYRDANGRGFNNHIKFAIRYEKDFVQQLSTWYAYDRHAQITLRDKVIYPPAFQGEPVQLPGRSKPVYTGQPIIANGNFTWGEATHNGTRIPATTTIVNNIIDLARKLQAARKLLGASFTINSWYRDPAANAAAGGASRSYHLQGRAVDLSVAGYSALAAANALYTSWAGGIIYYSTHLHLDTGGKFFGRG